MLTYLIFKYFKNLGYLPDLSTLQKTLSIFLAVVAGLLTLKIKLDVCARLHLSILVGGLIFIFFPFLLAYTMAPVIYWPTQSHQAPTVNNPNLPAQNTIILLFDELSDTAAKPISTQLKDDGLHVTFLGIDSVGKNTINVIPSIWSRSNFDQSVPCGPTQLCSGGKVLDFSKVQASSKNIDIVGFYHRYCSIKGLRFCSFAPLPQRSIFIDFTCIFPVFNKLVDCEAKYTSDRQSWIALRDSMQHKLFEAPFWQKGGILFAHLLVPHPLMGIPLKPLQDEYTDNIAYGTELVKLVARKAKILFGDDFKIVVFSDHPLRTEFWCATNHYKSFGCAPTSDQISTKVPLIVVTTSEDKELKSKLHSNSDIFDLLY